jgi:hypothetical protein
MLGMVLSGGSMTGLERRLFWTAVLAVAGFSTTAQASLPVPYAVVGCILNGTFRSSGLTSSSLADPAIKALEGKTIRVEGYLSPGDRFSATGIFVVNERCREELFKRYFLCDPCQTLPGMAHKEAPKQPGRKINLSPEAVREFDNFSRWRQR